MSSMSYTEWVNTDSRINGPLVALWVSGCGWWKHSLTIPPPSIVPSASSLKWTRSFMRPAYRHWLEPLSSYSTDCFVLCVPDYGALLGMQVLTLILKVKVPILQGGQRGLGTMADLLYHRERPPHHLLNPLGPRKWEIWSFRTRRSLRNIMITLCGKTFHWFIFILNKIASHWYIEGIHGHWGWGIFIKDMQQQPLS